MDRITRATMSVGMAVLMLAIVLIFSEMVEDSIITVVVAVASGLLFFAIFRAYFTRKGEVYKDERTQKIHNSALSISWWVAYVILAATYLLIISDAVAIELQEFIPLMFFLMLTSYWLSKYYLSHKGG